MLLAFYDDIYVVTPDPGRVGPICAVLQEHLTVMQGMIRINGARRRCGTVVGRDQKLAMCLNRLSTLTPKSGAPHLPESEQFLPKKALKHRTLLDRIPQLPDVQLVIALAL